jgi:hypothetical protein
LLDATKTNKKGIVACCHAQTASTWFIFSMTVHE